MTWTITIINNIKNNKNNNDNTKAKREAKRAAAAASPSKSWLSSIFRGRLVIIMMIIITIMIMIMIIIIMIGWLTYQGLGGGGGGIDDEEEGARKEQHELEAVVEGVGSPQQARMMASKNNAVERRSSAKWLLLWRSQNTNPELKSSSVALSREVPTSELFQFWLTLL